MKGEEIIRKNLNEKLINSGKSIRYVARKSGVSSSAISRYLNGYTDMQISNYVKIMDAISNILD